MKCSGLPDPEVGLPDVRTMGSHGFDEVDAVIDDQGHVGAVQNRHDLTAETAQLVVRGVLVAQLHDADSSADRRTARHSSSGLGSVTRLVNEGPRARAPLERGDVGP